MPGASVAASQVGTSLKDRGALFVVHGRNLVARDAMVAFLAGLGLDPKSSSARGAAANSGNAWAIDVLTWHPELAFFDDLSKKWVEQVDSGRGPGSQLRANRIVRTRAQGDAG